MQEVLGTGQAESVKSSKRHRQGHRTEAEVAEGERRLAQIAVESFEASWGEIDALISTHAQV